MSDLKALAVAAMNVFSSGMRTSQVEAHVRELAERSDEDTGGFYADLYGADAAAIARLIVAALDE